MSDDEEFVIWGTIHGWSKKLGIPEEVLKERCQGLPMQPCRAADPHDPEYQIVVEAYAEPDVLRVCTDLLVARNPESHMLNGK